MEFPYSPKTRIGHISFDLRPQELSLKVAGVEFYALSFGKNQLFFSASKIKSSKLMIFDLFSIASLRNPMEFPYNPKTRIGHISFNLRPQELSSKLAGVEFDALSFGENRFCDFCSKNQVFKNHDFLSILNCKFTKFNGVSLQPENSNRPYLFRFEASGGLLEGSRGRI